jgi:MinD superfamily P-loop ATPase
MSIENDLDELEIETVSVEPPQLDESKCKKCGTCQLNCPTKAINLNPYPQFDSKRCIRCDVCYKLCPNNALKIDKPLLD